MQHPISIARMDEWDTTHCQDGWVRKQRRHRITEQFRLEKTSQLTQPNHQSGRLSVITKPRPLVPRPRVFLIPPGMGTPLPHWTPVPMLEAKGDLPEMLMDQQEDEAQCTSSFPCTQHPHPDH